MSGIRLRTYLGTIQSITANNAKIMYVSQHGKGLMEHSKDKSILQTVNV